MRRTIAPRPVHWHISNHRHIALYPTKSALLRRIRPIVNNNLIRNELTEDKLIDYPCNSYALILCLPSDPFIRLRADSPAYRHGIGHLLATCSRSCSSACHYLPLLHLRTYSAAFASASAMATMSSVLNTASITGSLCLMMCSSESSSDSLVSYVGTGNTSA